VTKFFLELLKGRASVGEVGGLAGVPRLVGVDWKTFSED
jgi:hypothetical protein